MQTARRRAKLLATILLPILGTTFAWGQAETEDHTIFTRFQYSF